MVKKKIETRPWDASEHLGTEDDMAAYLDAALEDGDPILAVGDIARQGSVADCPRVQDVATR